MPNDIPYLDFITGKSRRSDSAPIPDAGPDEAEIDAFKASVLAKLALAVGKDGDAATPRDWFVATALALRDRIVHRWLAVNPASHAGGRDGHAARPRACSLGPALALPARLVHRWLAVTRASHAEGKKHVYYLSL